MCGFVNNSHGFRNSSRNLMNRSGILTETSNKEADAPPNLWMFMVDISRVNWVYKPT